MEHNEKWEIQSLKLWHKLRSTSLLIVTCASYYRNKYLFCNHQPFLCIEQPERDWRVGSSAHRQHIPTKEDASFLVLFCLLFFFHENICLPLKNWKGWSECLFHIFYCRGQFLKMSWHWPPHVEYILTLGVHTTWLQPWKILVKELVSLGELGNMLSLNLLRIVLNEILNLFVFFFCMSSSLPKCNSTHGNG